MQKISLISLSILSHNFGSVASISKFNFQCTHDIAPIMLARVWKYWRWETKNGLQYQLNRGWNVTMAIVTILWLGSIKIKQIFILYHSWVKRHLGSGCKLSNVPRSENWFLCHLCDPKRSDIRHNEESAV